MQGYPIRWDTLLIIMACPHSCFGRCNKMDKRLYYPYSEYLKEIYKEKVYKLPICLPLSCPNRKDGSTGCVFCAGIGTGFESEAMGKTVSEQLENVRQLVERKYGARKFIAYFQNYTNTYLAPAEFEDYINEAAKYQDIVEIAVSTRPDCIRGEYLDILKKASEMHSVRITIELGLQTANYRTLDTMNRGHGLAEYIDSMRAVKEYCFDTCTHVILNLPGDDMRDVIETSKILSACGTDIAKIHSLYIAENSVLYDWYKDGRISLCSKEEYIERLRIFLEYLSPGIAIERLFSRIPKEDAAFSNWGTSWWKLRDELEEQMREKKSYQGKAFDYLNGSGLKQLLNCKDTVQ